MKKIYILFLLATLFGLSACDKYLDIKPVGSVIPITLAEHRALLSRAYKNLPSDRGLVNFRSDEMVAASNRLSYYRDIESWNDVSPSDGTAIFSWDKFYAVSFVANQLIDNRKNITEGNEQELNQLIGEAYLLRAYVHFLLVNLHGRPYTQLGALQSKSIPLKLDVDLEKVLERNTVEEVYTSILEDIASARALINEESWELAFSYRFNTISVEAFQSRVSLYMGDWDVAYKASEAVLAKKSSLEDLNVAAAMLPNNYESVEAITPLEQVISSSVATAAQVSPVLLGMYAEGDQRPTLYFEAPDAAGNRLSIKGEYSKFRCTFRVGEMYLNAAEAATHLNKLPEARSRLLALMQKRYTTEAYTVKAAAVNAMGQAALITEIINERARELAFEGHRWFDLRRTTRPRIEKVLSEKTYVLKQDDPRYTVPIPKEAIAANPGLAN